MAVTVPAKIYAGDQLKIEVPGYESGSTCQVTLTSKGRHYQATGVQDGDCWLVTFASSTTTGFQVASYQYHIGVTTSGERETIQTGNIEVLPNLAGGPVDTRGHVEKVLDAIEATLEGKASVDTEMVTIAGKSIKRFTPEQLLVWRDKYRAELVQIKRKEALANGLPHSGKIQVRF